MQGTLKNRQLDFTQQDFLRARHLIHQQAGIALSEAKFDMVYSRIGKRLRLLNLPSFKSYLDYLEHGNDVAEWQAFINGLTTNLTSFYREAHHFTMLAEHLASLKHLASLNKTNSEPIKIWCCAASSGEEPITIAITACEVFGTMTPPVQIIATDIDTDVLEIAASGEYTKDAIKKLPPAILKQYFQRGIGINEGMVRICHEIKALIQYKALNLCAEDWPIDGQFDVIFCRNVMIYFDKATQSRVLAGLAAKLRTKGLLFVGHSENFAHATTNFKLRGKTVYELNQPTSLIANINQQQSVQVI